MKKELSIFFCLFAILSIIVLFPHCSDTINTEVNFITDKANLLSGNQKEEIQKLLSIHNRKYLGRIFLKIISELPQDTSIEQYALKTINERLFSVNEKNDRILVVIALKNRMMRIETSLDVWKILDDESCSEIINKKFTPSFKENNYYQGIELGLKTIIDKLENHKEESRGLTRRFPLKYSGISQTTLNKLADGISARPKIKHGG